MMSGCSPTTGRRPLASDRPSSSLDNDMRMRALRYTLTSTMTEPVWSWEASIASDASTMLLRDDDECHGDDLRIDDPRRRTTLESSDEEFEAAFGSRVGQARRGSRNRGERASRDASPVPPVPVAATEVTAPHAEPVAWDGSRRARFAPPPTPRGRTRGLAAARATSFTTTIKSTSGRVSVSKMFEAAGSRCPTGGGTPRRLTMSEEDLLPGGGMSALALHDRNTAGSGSCRAKRKRTSCYEDEVGNSDAAEESSGESSSPDTVTRDISRV